MCRVFPFSLLVLSLFAPTIAAQTPVTADAKKLEIQVQVDRLPVIDQGNSGTCWAFATTSFLESEIARIRGEHVDLSEMNTVYWGYVEKANRYVRLHGKAQFSQGGLSHDVVWIAKHHGLVPESAYTGLPDGQRHFDHDELEAVMKAVLDAVADSDHPSEEWQKAVRGVLDAYLGAPPKTVDVDGKEVTPEQYARQVLNLPLDDYVELMSFWYLPIRRARGAARAGQLDAGLVGTGTCRWTS